MEINKANIANALTSIAPDHVVAVADDIYDEGAGKYQTEINATKIEAEETSEIVDNIEETLVTNALRKSSQILDENEKQQIRMNIGEEREASNEGMGYVVLKKGVPFKEQVDKRYGGVVNTIYEIKYDFDLGGDTDVWIADNCVLKFKGGKISNGTLSFNNMSIHADLVTIFDKVILKTRYDKQSNLHYIHPDWFSGTDREKLQACIDVCRNGSSWYNPIILLTRTYTVDDELDCTFLENTAGPIVRKTIHMKGTNRNQAQIVANDPKINNKPVFNCTGVNRATFEDFVVYSSVTPACAFMISRNDTNTNAGNNIFRNIQISGNYSLEWNVVLVGSESNVFDTCALSVYADSFMPNGIVSNYYTRDTEATGGTTINRFLYCDCTNIALGADVENTTFDTCYFLGQLRFVRTCRNVNFINVRNENYDSSGASIYIEKDVEVRNLFVTGRFAKGIYGAENSALIECDIQAQIATLNPEGIKTEYEETIMSGACVVVDNLMFNTINNLGSICIGRKQNYGNNLISITNYANALQTYRWVHYDPSKDVCIHYQGLYGNREYDFMRKMKVGALSFDYEIINITSDQKLILDGLTCTHKVINLSANITGMEMTNVLSHLQSKNAYFVLSFRQDSTGGHTVAFRTNNYPYIQIIGGAAPILDTTPNSETVVEVYAENGNFVMRQSSLLHRGNIADIPISANDKNRIPAGSIVHNVPTKELAHFDGERWQKIQCVNSGDRPTSPDVGTMHFDTLSNKPIWWTGSAWVDATGATV